MITEAQRHALLTAARQVRQNAHAPYSHYQVGAAVLAADGVIYTGCNIENASYGLTVCAERHAIAHMVQAGQRQLVALAVATSNGVAPCGACRQVLREFAADLPIWLLGLDDDSVHQTSLQQLLPNSFNAGQLPE